MTTRRKGQWKNGKFHVYRPSARELKIAADMQAPPKELQRRIASERPDYDPMQYGGGKCDDDPE